MIFEGGLVFDLHGPRLATTTWHRLGDEFFHHVNEPALVQLVVTDRYEQVVNHWNRQTTWESGDEASAIYAEGKIDGRRAAAKTVVLDRRQAVVVAAAATLDLGLDVARWMLTHEAQHVRLHQSDSAAWAVHRRSGQEIISPRPWVFVWAAQSAIDEFRCEQAVHSQLSPLPHTYDPADVQAVLRQLREARTVSRTDLNQAYEIVTQAIDRLAVMAAYSGAAIAAGSDTKQRWAGVHELDRIWACLGRTPTLGDPVSHSQLWEHAVETSAVLDQMLQLVGVELRCTDDEGMALYFH